MEYMLKLLHHSIDPLSSKIEESFSSLKRYNKQSIAFSWISLFQLLCKFVILIFEYLGQKGMNFSIQPQN